MPSLKNDLIHGITKVKQELYPLLAKAECLNESALSASDNLQQAWKLLETANETIKARADEVIPPIQRRF